MLFIGGAESERSRCLVCVRVSLRDGVHDIRSDAMRLRVTMLQRQRRHGRGGSLGRPCTYAIVKRTTEAFGLLLATPDLASRARKRRRSL